MRQAAIATPPIAFPYRRARHAALPHIVKFSGGRSSATLTFMLAEAGLLKPERGDVILFANTSAEHPATYEFAAECKERLEREFGLPVFWYEFCTVENASRGEYARKLSYRLVKPVPVEEDPNGYRSGGEVFEEMLSYQGMLPNPHSRSCTAKLKLYPSHLLLAEWLGAGTGPAHAGHYASQSFVTPQSAAERHLANGGMSSAESYAERVEYMTSMPPARPAQLWRDYTDAPIDCGDVNAPARPVDMWGKGAAEFVALLGLRADERRRIDRVLSRTLLAEGAGGRLCSIRTQPPGEHPYFPLDNAGITADDVGTFWREQAFDLQTPPSGGNCVFCFMKGTEALRQAGQEDDPQRVSGAPSDIAWWMDIERRYRREAPARNGDGVSKFGFLGVAGPSFADVASGTVARRSRYAVGAPACDCTD